MHYLDWNTAGADAPVLMLVHGFRGHAHWWDGIAPYLAQTYRVVAIDLPGMGDSEPWPEYAMRYAAEAINTLIDHLDCAPVIGIGHSYGGVRLLQACAERPEQIQHVVMLDSFVLLPGVVIPPDTASTSGKRYYPDRSIALGRYRLMPQQPVPIPAIVEHIAEHSLRQEAQGWCWKFDPALPRGADNEEPGLTLLAQVRCSVDVVFCEHSQVVDAATAQRCVELLPSGRGPICLPGTHHHLMIDQPLALIALLRGLLVGGVAT